MVCSNCHSHFEIPRDHGRKGIVCSLCGKPIATQLTCDSDKIDPSFPVGKRTTETPGHIVNKVPIDREIPGPPPPHREGRWGLFLLGYQFVLSPSG